MSIGNVVEHVSGIVYVTAEYMFGGMRDILVKVSILVGGEEWLGVEGWVCVWVVMMG